MSSPSMASPDTPITVKVTFEESTRRFKLLLKDVGPAVFQKKLRELLDISPERTVVFERYSDSAQDYVTLNPENTAVYKQLFRAAKAKLKLRIRVTPITPSIDLLSDNPLPPPSTHPASCSATLVNQPSVSTLRGDTSPSPVPSKAELDEAVARAVTEYCASTEFSEQLRDTVRSEVEKHAPSEPALSAPSLVSEQKGPPATGIDSICRGLGAVQLSGFAIYCNNCNQPVSGVHHHCNICDEGDYDLCQTCTNNGIHCESFKHWLIKRDFVDGKVVSSSTDYIRRTSRICNGCALEIDDTRLVKCTQCEDYDLCIPCLENAKHGHNPGHDFVRGSGNVHLTASQEGLLARGRGVVHHALCDKCDKGIIGIRHKCIDCPDWDYCNACIVNASTDHPGHRFVAIYEQDGVAPLCQVGPYARVSHPGVYCDGPICAEQGKGVPIRGPRYKCAICPDTDFCGICEASPSNNHNPTHPLIKMKTPIRNVQVTTTDNTDNVLGDGYRPDRPQSEPATANVATQVQTVADVKPTEEVVRSEKLEPAPSEPQPIPVKTEDLAASFVSDYVKDGDVYVPGQNFRQAWVMRNTGTTSWPIGVSVQFVGGDYMHLKNDERTLDATVLDYEVKPGKQALFSVSLTATWPAQKRYVSYWRLTTPDGRRFGENIWCNIEVREPEVAPEPEVIPRPEVTPTPEVAPKIEETKSVQTSAAPSITATEGTRGSSEFESAQDSLQGTQSSQMVFPKLPVESPVHSTEQLPPAPVPRPVSPVPSHNTMPEDLEEVDVSSLGDDDTFETDEEYDVLDASDEEPFVECERVA